MLSRKSFNDARGFSDEYRPGEYYFSVNMGPTIHGQGPCWLMLSQNDSSVLAELGLLTWITQAKISTRNLYATDGLDIFGYVSSVWTKKHTSANSVFGLIGDQKNRVLYVQGRYLGMSSDGASFNDIWKDFGGVVAADYMQADIYESDVLIARKNNICRLAADDSITADATPAFSLPAGFDIRSARSGKNGYLIGANFNSRAVLVLWDNYSDRSIAPWIWLDTNIQSIVPWGNSWLVICADEILVTNGYAAEHFAYPPQNVFGSVSSGFNVVPQGAVIVKQKLVILNSYSNYGKDKPGVYLLDLRTKSYNLVPAFNKQLYGATFGAVFYDSQADITIGLTSNVTGTDLKYVATLVKSVSPNGYLITGPLGDGNNEKTAEKVKLDIGSDDRTISATTFSCTVAVKIWNRRRELWQFAQQKSDAASLSLVTIDGTVGNYAEAEAGDEVTILSGASSGEVRHISSISGKGTATEVWTLDSALPSLLKLGDHINLSPFELLAKRSLTSVTEFKDLLFECKNKVKGKKFLVKIHFSGVSNLMPELQEGELVYDDLGTF